MADDTADQAAPKGEAAQSPPGPPGPIPAVNLITGNPQAGAMEGIGVTGLKVASGILFEEYLPELKGPNLFRIYKSMQDDPVVTAMLQAIVLILRAADWRIEPAGDDQMKPNMAGQTAQSRQAGRKSNFAAAAEQEAEFAKSLLDDMSHTWEDNISEILSMLAYGWSFHEIVLKKRMGPDQEDGSKRSRYNDGRIGVRKLPIRSQDTLLKWAMQDDGGIAGMIQQPITGGPTVFIPIERALLFRTTLRKGSPEGVSLLRSAYRPWYFKRHIEDMEAIGIERELAGLPVVRIPKKYLASGASAEEKAFRIQAEQMARDLKFNQQGGCVIPSDMWPNPDGSMSSTPLVDISLLTTAGRRAIETDPVVKRYNRDITRAALADFLTLGDDKGSYALSENKSELFLRACETYLNQVAAVINLYLLPRMFRYNGISSDLLPQAKPGRITPVDLAKIGAYLQQIGAAGAPLFPNQELSNYLADIAGMPEPPEDIGLMAKPGQKPGAGQIDPNTGEVINPKIDPESGVPLHELQQQQDADASFMNDNATATSQKRWLRKDGGGNPNHDERGRFATGPGIKAVGIDQVKNKRKEWEAESPMHSADDLTRYSKTNQEQFAGVGHRVATATGTEFVNPGPKSRARLVEKHLEILAKIERGKAPESITDAVRGGFKVTSPEQADHVISELGKHYEIADEGWASTDAGYFDRKVVARLPDRQLAEVQFWHPEMLAAKEGSGGGHRLYEAQQSLEKVNKRHPMIPEVKAAQRSLYAGARSRMGASWQALHMPSV